MAKQYTTSMFGDPPDPGFLEWRGKVDNHLLELSRARDTEIERSIHGGLNSKIRGRFDLIDTDALERLAAVLEYGTTKYSEDNWRLDPVELHLSHAIQHLYKYLRIRRERLDHTVPFKEDGSIDELGHAFCRVMFALAVEYQDPEYYKQVQKNNGIVQEENSNVP